MKLPRDVEGHELARRLRSYGYEVTRQHGSHLRLTTQRGGQHHVTVPLHRPLKIGTLAEIVKDVAAHADEERDIVANTLFG